MFQNLVWLTPPKQGQLRSAGSKLQRAKGPIPPRRSHPILPSGRHVPSAPRRATHCSPQEESGHMVIRRRDPDDVTLQGTMAPSQHNREEASDTPRHAELARRLTSCRGGSQALCLPQSTSPATPHRKARRPELCDMGFFIADSI